MIGIFVLGSVWLVLIMGKRMQAENSMTAVLSAGMGVCGVSATVAASPVVNAKAAEIAYTIGTILVWGVACMFIFPTIGHLLGMGPVQFGAWAGTGILNSAQVAGAALAFDPNGIETLKVAEIFNITRVLFLPIIVVWLAAWYVKREAGAQKVNLGQVLIAKFPVFVLGFILMFALSTLGVFSPAGHYQGKYFSGEQVKQDKLLGDKDIKALEAELNRLQGPEGTQSLTDHFTAKAVNIGQHHATAADAQQALRDLISHRKMTSRDQDGVLAATAKLSGLEAGAKGAIEKASKAAWHSSKTIAAFREWLAWLFAVGLIGLGMQITVKSLKQAGGKPLIEDARFREKLTATEIELKALELTQMRVVANESKNGRGKPDPASSILKIKGSEIQQTIAELQMQALGHYALPWLPEALDPAWPGEPVGADYAAPLSGHYFNYRKTTIYGGSNEIQKNIIAQMILGL